MRKKLESLYVNHKSSIHCGPFSGICPPTPGYFLAVDRNGSKIRTAANCSNQSTTTRFPAIRFALTRSHLPPTCALFSSITRFLLERSRKITWNVRRFGFSMRCKNNSNLLPCGAVLKQTFSLQGTLSDLLNHPKPWICLSSRGRSIYTKMMKFLSSDDLLDTVEKYKKGSESGTDVKQVYSLAFILYEILITR